MINGNNALQLEDEEDAEDRIDRLEGQVAALAADLLESEEVENLRQEVRTLRKEIPKLAKEALKEVQIVKIEVTATGREPIILDRQHRLFPSLLKRVAADVPVMLVGPAGSGKTTAAANVAKALDLPFYPQSVGLQTTKADLIGYKDANGVFHPSPLFRAYTGGGVYLLDELDAGNAGVLTIINSAMSNGHMTFGDGERYERHPDFRPIAAANTYGTGANRQYVGRNQLDASTLDRFGDMEWGYDEEFERYLALLENPGASEWINWVQRVRKVVEEKKILHIVSPRASIFGARLLMVGIPRQEVEKEWVWKNLTPIQILQIKGGH